VVGVREQIEPAHLLGDVAVPLKRLQIPGEGDRVAGDVDDARGSETRKEVDDLPPGSGARRIEDDDTVPQAGAVCGGCRVRQRGQPPIHPPGLGAGADPLREVLPGVIGGAGIRLDGRDPSRRAPDSRDRRREQADAAVEVQMVGVGVDGARDRIGDGGAKRRCGETMHLPEATGIHPELACRGRPRSPHRRDRFGEGLEPGRVERRRGNTLAHGGPPPTAVAPACRGSGCGALGTSRADGVGAHDDPDLPVRGLDEVDPTGLSAALALSRAGEGGASESGRGQWQLVDLDDAMAARRERTDPTVGVDVQAEPGAPSRGVLALVHPGRDSGALHRHRQVQTADTRERITDHLRLQLTLMAELDVPEVRTPGTGLGSDVDICGPPHVGATMRRGLENLEHLAAPERGLAGVGEAHTHPFTRKGVGHEDDTPLVPADEHAAMCDTGDVEVDEVALLHPPILPHAADGAYAGQMRVCLASTSPARLMLLRQAGIEPLTRAPQVDEEAVIAAVEAHEERTLSPDEHVLLLARRKAADVAAALAAEDPAFDGLVIGGDSMFELGGEVLGKPYEPAIARARWQAMRGRTGVLHSGHSVFRIAPGQPAQEAHAVAAASVSFAADVSDAEIDAYVASGEPLLVAGAFTVDSLGGAFIERVDGDPSTVVGMSLSTVRHLAAELGVVWTDLWTAPAGSHPVAS